MKLVRPPPAVLQRAIHEAGHAVIGHALGLEVTEVSIGEGGGHTKIRSNPPRNAEESYNSKLISATFSLAGGAAEEQKYGLDASQGHTEDVAKGLRAVADIATDEEDFLRLRLAVLSDTRALVKEHRLAIEAVAEALVKLDTLTGQQFLEILATVETN